MNHADSRRGERSTRQLPLVVLLVGSLMLLMGSASVPPADAAASPNIVLINLDDADMDLLGEAGVDAYFPNIRSLLQEGGTRFTNFHVVAPVCGPSRGALFRGQYPHNTGIQRNAYGWQVFHESGSTDDEFGMWMRESGYHTALVGKYCHEKYPQASHSNTFVPPGWDDFRASLGGKYFGTSRNLNGTRTMNPSDAYRTDIESAEAVDIISSHDQTSPLFLYLAPFAPHVAQDDGPMVAPRHSTAFPSAEVPRTPDFAEVDMSDKTAQYQQLPPVNTADQDALFRERLRAVLAVDELVGNVFSALDEAQMTDDTYVFLTSDNGYQLGHHRSEQKRAPYERLTRVQLLVRGPGVAQDQTHEHLLGHIDLAPTFLDLAGSSVPEHVDGVSFADLLDDPTVDASTWRTPLLIENADHSSLTGLLLDYVALRRFDDVYIEWAHGAREYYDLSEDRFQLDNQWPTLAGAQKVALQAELDALRNCRGGSCSSGSAPAEVATTLGFGAGHEVGPGSVVLSGSALGGNGVAAVNLVLRRVSDDTYWNGAGFSSDYANFAATSVGAGTSVDWQHVVTGLGHGEYWLSARAVDTAGTSAARAATGFFTVGSNPDTQFCDATSWNVSTGPNLRRALGCFMVSASTGSHLITLTSDIDLATATPWIDQADTSKSLVIDGEAHTIDGSGLATVFRVVSGRVTIEDLTITGGSDRNGGAVLNDGGDVTISDATLTGNTASFSGGAVYNNSGSMQISTTSIVDNDGLFGGGVAVGGGTTTIVRSSIDRNSAEWYGGGLLNNGGELVLDQVSVTRNDADRGGGVYNHGGVLLLVNSTVSTNAAVIDGGGVANYATATLVHTTVSGNAAPNGAGVWAWSGDDVATQIAASVVSANAGDDLGAPAGTSSGFVSGGGNVLGASAEAFVVTGPNDAIGNSPGLSALAPATPTGAEVHRLEPGSPALNRVTGAVDGFGVVLPTSDQTGGDRLLDAAPDSGAVEAVRCDGLVVTIDIGAGDSPTPGADVIMGTDGADTINGLAGNDTICGAGGDDTIFGAGGADAIFGGPGADDLRGHDGDDLIRGDGDDDELRGGSGNDTLYGGFGEDRLSGHDGDDILHGGAGNDRLFGNIDDDQLFGEGDDDTLRGGGGVDTLRGGSGADLLAGGPDGDIMSGNTGDDTLYGNSGDDDMFGGSGDNDFLGGGPGADDMNGGPGIDDTCQGGAGSPDTAVNCENVGGLPGSVPPWAVEDLTGQT